MPRKARHALLDQLKMVRACAVELAIVLNREIPADDSSPRLESVADQAFA